LNESQELSPFVGREQHKDTILTWYLYLAGVREQGKCTRGFPGTWERLPTSIRTPVGDYGRTTPGFLCKVLRHRKSETMRTKRWYCQTKETKGGGKRGSCRNTGIVPMKQENSPGRILQREGRISYFGIVGRKHYECVGIQEGVNETTTNSGIGGAIAGDGIHIHRI
jgi:hypothetical protein